jgi:hypothetical protein
MQVCTRRPAITRATGQRSRLASSRSNNHVFDRRTEHFRFLPLPAGAPTEYSGYATCADALADIPGYTYVVKMLKNCPDLDAMHSDPTQQKTFFVPSNAVSSTVG